MRRIASSLLLTCALLLLALTATAWGEELDRDRHVLSHEVKAITYHGLKVEQDADGWQAEIIVDI